MMSLDEVLHQGKLLHQAKEFLEKARNLLMEWTVANATTELRDTWLWEESSTLINAIDLAELQLQQRRERR